MSGRGEPEDQDYTGGDRGSESGLSPVTTPPLQGGDTEEYDVVEVDGRGEPLGGDRQQPEPRDAPLTQDAGGDQPLIRQQPDDQQRQRPKTRSERRRAAKQGREEGEMERQRLEMENRQLRERMDNLEGVVTSQVAPRLTELGEANIRNQIASIDQQLNDENARFRQATESIATAMEQSDHKALVAALEQRDLALVRKTQLNNTKVSIEISLKNRTEGRPSGDGGQQRQTGDQGDGRRQQQTQERPPLPPQAQAYVQEFAQDHPWFNSRGGDLDSITVLGIDNDVANRGFRNTDPEYWDEVERMMRERLPHRFQQDQRMVDDPAPRQPQRQAAQQPAQRRGPPVPSPADRSPPANGRQQVKISPERKEAMIQSGSIDSSGRIINKDKYNGQLKRFMEYDRNNATGR